MRRRHRPSDGDGPGRHGHWRARGARRTLHPRRNATSPGALEASATDNRTDARTEDDRTGGSRTKVTSRVTRALSSASSRKPRLGGTHSFRRRHRSPPAAREGRSSMFGERIRRTDSANGCRPRSSGDAAEIQVGPQRAGRGDQFRIMGDRPSEPIDVTRLECRDLAERMSVELPELDDVRGRVLQGRQWGGPEARIAATVQWTGGCRGTPGFTVEPLGPRRLLAARRSRRAGSGVAGPEGFRRIEAAGNRAGGSRRGRSARASSRGAARIGPGAPARADLELLVGPVDLGHLPGCGPGSGRIGARHVRMVHPGQLPPGGLDRGL